MKSVGLQKEVPASLLLLNRSASYISLKRYVPALNDANQAAGIDPLNWKTHWRKGVALMAMSKRLFRSKQALEAFEKCLECETLPENKRSEVDSEIKKAQRRLQQQQDEVRMRDSIIIRARIKICMSGLLDDRVYKIWSMLFVFDFRFN